MQTCTCEDIEHMYYKMDSRFKLFCVFILCYYSCAVSASDDGAVLTASDLVDYRRILSVVEKLEKRVDDLEAENVELRSESVLQKSEIAELRAMMLHHEQEVHEESSSQPNTKTSRDSGDTSGSKEIHTTNRIRRHSPDMTIAFYASLDSRVEHLGLGQSVCFDKVVTNIGQAYDPYTGTFRAPLPGVYVFSTTIMTDNRVTTHYGFAVNRKTITQILVHGSESQYDGDSQSVILQLHQGDDVSIQHTESDKSIYGQNYSVFSGFLLSAVEEGTPSTIIG